MNDVQSAKSLVLRYFDALESAEIGALAEVVERFTAKDYLVRAVHPFNEIHGASACAEQLIAPIRRSIRPLERRQEVFMAAPNLIDGGLWVTSMGKLLGLFDEPLLGIPAHRKLVMLPYCEFHKVDGDKIVESAFFCDLISLMQQVGLHPLPMQTGAAILNPGPKTQDGLLFAPQDPSESQATLDLIMRMCSDLVDKDGFQSPDSSLADTWHETMLWFGPAGIGATYTIPRYQLQHQGPFREGLDQIDFNGNVLEHAEGAYGGWFGWPNLKIRQGRGFVGMPASEQMTEMRVVDIYRRDGDKLAENWIFIDMLHYLKLLGLDVLDRSSSIHGQ